MISKDEREEFERELRNGKFEHPNDTMIGGNHYKKLRIEPWDVIESNNMGFFDGNALKYIMRYKEKNGVEDLKKARHYIDKLIEIEESHR